MWTSGYNLEPNLQNESTESLLLISVLGQHVLKDHALSELRRRKAIREENDFSGLFMTDLSGVY